MKYPYYARDANGIVSRVLTPQEVAQRYAYSLKTLEAQRYRNQGIPFITLHDKPFYLESEVEAYLQRRRALYRKVEKLSPICNRGRKNTKR
jgi:hypothetical protein